MEVIVYPILVGNDQNQSNDPIEIADRWRLADSGTFLIGKNNWWHGGAHFKSKTDTGKNHLSRTKEEYLAYPSSPTLTPNITLFPPTPIMGAGSNKPMPTTPASILGLPGQTSSTDLLAQIMGLGTPNSNSPTGVCLPPPPPIIVNPPASIEKETFNEAVQTICRGRIIAYRINQDWKELEVFKEMRMNKIISSLEKYSTSFVLIEHNLEHDYVKFPNPPYEETLFKDYKFYTLYMHLAPIVELQKTDAYFPWFLATQRKELVTPLKRTEEIVLVDSNTGNSTTSIIDATNNNLVCIAHPTLGNIFIPKTSIIKLRGTSRYFIGYPLSYYYESASSKVDQLDSSIQLDQVVIPTSPIPVEAGEVIGLPGGTIIDKKHVGGLFHFEIFANKNDFMDNTKTSVEAWPCYANTTKNYYILVNSQAHKSPFMSGEMYHHRHHGGAAGPEWQNYYHLSSEYDSVAGTIDNTLFDGVTTPAYQINGVPVADTLEVYSDAEWKEGPNPWQVKPATDYLTANGEIDVSKILPANTEKMGFKFKSEWSDDGIDTRYGSLKKVITDYQRFLDFIKEHCFWKDVQTVTDFPATDDVWYFHPVGFITQLRKVITPYFDADPVKLARYIDRQANESIVKLRQREQELNDWLGTAVKTDVEPNGSISQTIKDQFESWFGFYYVAPPAPAPVPAPAVKPPFTLPASPPPVFQGQYDDKSRPVASLPNITTLPHSIIWVRDIIRNNITLLEKLGTKHYVKGFSGGYVNTYAYVYGPDERHHIHLSNLFLPNKNIDNTEPRLAIHDSDPPECGPTIVHECSHFSDVGEMVDNAGTLVEGGLYDLRIDIPDPTNPAIDIETYGPYGRSECQDLAQRHPVAALCNADNFAYYIYHDVNKTDIEAYEYYD